LIERQRLTHLPPIIETQVTPAAIVSATRSQGGRRVDNISHTHHPTPPPPPAAMAI